MFDGIKLKNLISTPEEVHTFLVGLFEVLCPWRPCLPRCSKSKREMSGEYHYYMGGRAAGFPVLILILIGLAKLAKEALL